MAGVVVGIDGSDNAHRALDWALKEAAALHAPLTVLTVHEVAVSAWTGNPIILPPDQDELEKTRRRVEEIVAKAATQAGEPEPPSITVRAEIGLAARVLIEASVTLTCWWWGHAAAVVSRARCWARSASRSSSTRSARWSWCPTGSKSHG